MGKRQHDPYKWRTAGDVHETAALRGATVKHERNWTVISTPKGKMKITPNPNQELDSRTLSNARRWFKLLGLLALVVMAVVRLSG